MKQCFVLLACVAITSCRSLGTPSSPAAIEAYDPRVALEMAQFSDMAYLEDREQLRSALAARGYKLDNYVIDDASTDTSGFIAYNESTAVLAYTGTETDFDDYVQDLKTGKYQRIDETYCNGEATMHGGFHLPVVNLIKDRALYATLHRHQAAGRSLRFTGHSLGGALATVTAYYATVDQPDLRIAQIHTFGQPATGNVAFADCYDAKLKDVTYRHVNNVDMVPRLRAKPFSGYRHIGTLVYFGRAGRTQSYGTWSVTDMLSDFFHGGSLRDHRMARYIELADRNKELKPLVLD